MVDRAFPAKLRSCHTVADVFELVRAVAREQLGGEQAGLMVGLADLGTQPHGFIGAYYAPSANIIIINRRILERVKKKQPSLYLPYLFHLLLHEYIHSLGVYNEPETRKLTYEVSKVLGHKKIVEMATDMGQFFPDLMYSRFKEPPANLDIEYVMGIDRKGMNYIA